MLDKSGLIGKESFNSTCVGKAYETDTEKGSTQC